VSAALMNLWQIVGSFTYRGPVAELSAIRREVRQEGMVGAPMQAEQTAAPGPPRQTGRPPRTTPLAGWPDLRRLVGVQAPLLSAPQPDGRGLCEICYGPQDQGSPRCFPCDLHLQCARDSLADVVVPVAFAVKGDAHARRLWQYKSSRLSAEARAETAAMLRALLLVFLRDHGVCLWRAAGVPGPSHLAVVPTARGRPGMHPLRELVEDYLAIPCAKLSARSGEVQVRDLDPDRFMAGPMPGAKVLLIDDTWTTGSSAQSAAMALRRAGAATVIIVVLGRHVGRAEASAAGVGPATTPFRTRSCALHCDRVAAPDHRLGA
jgi:hypothetical protein